MTELCGAGSSDDGSPEDIDTTVGVTYGSIDLGLLYSFSPTGRIGLMVKNLYGRPYNIRAEATDFSPPRYYTIGISNERWESTLSADMEIINDHFGMIKPKKAIFYTLKMGMEKRATKWLILRGGIMYPIKAWLSTKGDIKRNFPSPKFNVSIGAGLCLGRLAIDLAAYGDPAKSYMEDSARPGANITVSYSF